MLEKIETYIKWRGGESDSEANIEYCYKGKVVSKEEFERLMNSNEKKDNTQQTIR